ncbi:hypothetical protein [Hymenobacter tenuis]
MNLNLKGKNLVIGLASKYKYSDLLPFVESLRETGYDGDLVWFVSKLDNECLVKLRQDGVICITYEETYPYFKEVNLIKALPEQSDQLFSPNSLRFIFYKVFMSLYGHLYERILHADTRDVYFQEDIFSKPWQDGVYCFLEDRSETIKSQKYNALWIKAGFGEDVLNEIGDNPISCCGVVYGTAQYFIKYVDVMVQLIISIPPQTGVLEQGIHNYLLYKSKIKNSIIVNDDEGEVSTLTTFKPFNNISFDTKKRILNVDGQVVSIIHQYDRHLRLLWRYNKRAFFTKVENLAKRKILLAMGRKFND